MKALSSTVAVCVAALGGVAFASSADRIQDAARVVRSIRANPDLGIPQDEENRPDCVIVIPSLKKAAFIYGGEYGKGLMSCFRNGSWSAPIFMELKRGSWGLQLGAASIDLVLLVMNNEGMEKLLRNKVTLGLDASAVAGPVGRDARAGTDAQMKAEILSYSRARGLFAGIDFSGGVLKPDRDENSKLYGKGIEPRAIVLGDGVDAPPETRPFLDALEAEAIAAIVKKPLSPIVLAR